MRFIGSLSPSSCRSRLEDSGPYRISCSALVPSRQEAWFLSSLALQCVSGTRTLRELVGLKEYTVVSALELTAQNIMCGSVRMVYAIIYTLFLVRLQLASCRAAR